MEIKYSKYQEALFYFIKNGEGNAVVQAVAGSGKSFSIVHALNYIPDSKRVLFLAFNKSTVEELKEKINKNNVTIRTSHSLGYLMLKTHFKYQGKILAKIFALEVDEYKYRNYFKNNFNEFTEDIQFSNKIEIENFKEIILSLIDICRVYLCKTHEDIEKIADKYGYSVTFDHVNILYKLIEWGKENIDTIDYTDMISLPNYFNIILNNLKYDWVIIDECQDQSVAMQELFKKCIKKDGRFLAVGDLRQAIMGFSGSNEQSFNELLKIPNTKKLDLSINYRCPKIVLPLARQFVPQFEIRENAPEGKINSDVLVKDIKPNSMVICRTTAPLVELYLKLIQKNIKCFIKGIDIGSNLIEIIQKCDTQYISVDLKKDGVVPRLYKKLLESRETLMVKKGLDINDATSERSIIQQIEIINTIKALSYNINNSFELIQRIKKIFQSPNNDKNGIMLITAHKAKGLEHDNVYLLCPSLVPSKLATKDWEKESERNLLYVIYTRTKNEFSTISETDFPPPQGSKDINDIITYLNSVSFSLKNLYEPKEVKEDESNMGTFDRVVKLLVNDRRQNEKILGKPLPLYEVPKEAADKYEKKLKRFESLMLGKSIEECYDHFNDLGISNDIRPVEYDGKPCMITDDFNPNRINVCISDNKIINVKEFG